MQANDSSSFRLLFLAEMNRLNRLNQRLREFSAEVRRQEDGLRALYPRIAQVLRGETWAASESHDERTTKH